MALRINVSTVVGARPQFVKAASVSRAIAGYNCENPHCIIDEKIVHTGQHYDENMSRVFFDELKIPSPFINLEVGSGPHGKQTALMLERLEGFFLESNPDIVLVYGDTNSTLAGSLAAVKLHIRVAHVEAGLRSFNRKMPEEINRLVADHLSNVLFCPTDTAVENLRKEGINGAVHKVGDVMYDSVLYNIRLAEKNSHILDRLKLIPKSYYLATIHRAENTDEPERLKNIIDAFASIDRQIILPLHPRTKKILGRKPENLASNIIIIDPVSYLDMLVLEKNSRVILTDSGGVQKEAYWFSVPCITLREETEWIELVKEGCNQVVGTDAGKIRRAVQKAENSTVASVHNLYGDGKAAEKIVKILLAAGRGS